MHPELDDVIRRIRANGMIAGLITNGYLLVPERIQRLNRAGLEWLQISIDNVNPDDVSKKSLKVLDKKLELAGRARRLSREHQFCSRRRHLASPGRAHDRQARHRTGIHLDHRNHPRWQRPVAAAERRRTPHLPRNAGYGEEQLHPHQRFSGQHRQGQPNDWRCRAGARYLYICENGLVHYCSQQRGYPGVPLETYTRDDLRREFSPKNPAPRIAPFRACIRSQSSIAGEPRRIPLKRSPTWPRRTNSCRSNSRWARPDHATVDARFKIAMSDHTWFRQLTSSLFVNWD